MLAVTECNLSVSADNFFSTLCNVVLVKLGRMIPNLNSRELKAFSNTLNMFTI